MNNNKIGSFEKLIESLMKLTRNFAEPKHTISTISSTCSETAQHARESQLEIP